MRHDSQRSFAWTGIGLALVALAMVGCAARVPEPATPNHPESPSSAPVPSVEPSATVRLYLVRGEKIGVDSARVRPTSDTATLVSRSLSALVTQPLSSKGFGFETAIPISTRVLGVSVADGSATVDLSSDFESGGGSLSMRLRVAQVVFTATQFTGVKRVAFKIDGAPVDTIGEGLSVDSPLSRADCEDVTPAILVESPLPGEEIASPVTVTGTADVFEGRFRAKVSDGMGGTLVELPVEAPSGTGDRRPFSATLPFPDLGGGVGSVSVYALSPKDGAPIDRVSIPVRLK